MENKNRIIQSVLLFFLCLLIIIGISVLFLSQMNETIANNTMNTISELAEHDRVSIQTFIDMKWYELYSTQERFEKSHHNTLSSLREQMALERSSSDFHSLYLVAEDGTVYTANGTGQTDILQYFEPEVDQIVRRYNYITKDNEEQVTLLYAIRLEDYQVEGIKFVALAGVSNMDQIQNNIMISSFVQDGRARGYSSVVNPNGDFIVNVRETESSGKQQNLFELLSIGVVDDKWNNDTIREKMANKETFSFYYTDENGVEKLLYFMPIDNTVWYFIPMVEKEVFSEQSHAFTFLSMGMLVIIIFIIIIVMMFVMVSHNKVLKANAEAKARSDFLSNMSHEIRTPLNGVIGLLHLMKTHVKDNDTEQMSTWIEKAHDTANYLLSLVSDILDMSKLQAGKLQLVPEPFLVESMLDAIWSMQHHNISARGIDFVVNKDITVPCIIGDEVRIKQVLMNIIGNAAKFTPEGGRIKLSISQKQTDKDHVTTTIVCEDNGIGMSPQFLETIWDSFTQEQNKNTSSIKGTGLGMAISKEFVNAMGGDILVDSKVGVGSTFTVILHSQIAEMEPVHSGETSEEPTEKANSRADHKPVKLLIAEDNNMNAEIIEAILTEEGYEVTLAENGQAAVDKFAQSQVWEFDIVLMDMQMPVLNGCQAASKIRELDRPDAKEVPIYACTANTFQEDKDKALQSGMNDFLTKPIDIDILLTKLQKLK